MIKDYRICMPMTVEEYQIGQLYMIARHSSENSDDKGEGVETIVNEACHDKKHGKGQYAEKRIHLTSKLPNWIKSLIPRFFYVTEKSWNYYPYTITEYTCSFIPKMSIKIWTRYENNNGCNDNVHAGENIEGTPVVEIIDIVSDPVRPHQYKEKEDPSKFKSKTTGRGPLSAGWRDTTTPIMCSYKLVDVSFPVFGLQTKVEDFLHKEIRNINVLAHRQAFTWMDEWHGWTMEDVRKFEEKKQQETNQIIREAQKKTTTPPNTPEDEVELDEEGNVKITRDSLDSTASKAASDTGSQKSGYLSSWFKWS